MDRHARLKSLERTQEMAKPLGNSLVPLLYKRRNNPHKALPEIYKKLDPLTQGLVAMTEAINNKKVSCSRKCSHCCYQLVTILPIEVKFIKSYVRKHNIPIDREHLESQSKLADPKGGMFSGSNWDPDSGDRWLLHPLPSRRCVFLTKDNECSIYEARPLTCRVYYALSPANECDTSILEEDNTVLVNTDVIYMSFIEALAKFFTQGNDSKRESLLTTEARKLLLHEAMYETFKDGGET